VQKDSQGIMQELADRDEHMDYLFSLLTQDKTYLTACQFLEDILQARKNVLNLKNISTCYHI
jgi:hypothetical protein